MTERLRFPDEPIRGGPIAVEVTADITYGPIRALASCGHLSCPEYRCFYDGLCEHDWGDPNDCRLPVDHEAWGDRFCTFHAEVELARAAKAYGEDLENAMTDKP
jgi:hypothetical protein